MATCFVTGALGFIGSHLCEKLLNDGFDVVGLDNLNGFYDPELKVANHHSIELTREKTGKKFDFYKGDIRHQGLLADLFSEHKIDTVYHLAAMAGVRPSQMNPRLYVDVNEMGTLNMLEEVKKAKIKNFVFASSSSVYGNAPQTPFSESQEVDHPISVYAATKKAGELLCHTYHKLYQIQVAALRFFTVYGPRQRPDLAIRKFARSILENKPLEIYGDGSKSRDYTFIDDIVSGVVASGRYLSATQSPVYEIFNLGESKSISVLELVQLLEKLLDKKAVLDFQSEMPGDVEKTFADISKAKRLLGYQPQTTMEQGLRKFLEWYRPLNQI